MGPKGGAAPDGGAGLVDFRRGFPGFCWVQMVSSCFSVGKKWNHLESCGLLSSLAGDVSNSETG